MDLTYLLTPLFAWIIAGSLKFFVNSTKAKRLAFGLIGYGGMPSNHSAIVSSTTMLIALKEGIAHPVFGVAITLSFIVILDATSLRKQVGKQASRINSITNGSVLGEPKLRERMGHTPIEILAGIATGIAVAYGATIVGL